jgi:hypothetical protein
MAGAFDYRSRTLDDVTVITAAELAARIPALLAERGALAAAAFKASGLSSFNVAVDEVFQT